MSWVKGQKGWLKGYVREREPPEIDQTQLDSPKKEPVLVIQIHGVTIKLPKCPRCQSKRQKCYMSKSPVRYHKCLDCGFRFKSQEIE